MPKIKGWDKIVSKSSPDKQDIANGPVIDKWVSIYGDEVVLFRNSVLECYRELNGDTVKELFFVDNDFYPNEKKWGVRFGDECEYYSTRKKAYDTAIKRMKELYPDSMIDDELQQQRKMGWR